ncbi:hypothetical protein ACX0MV_12445 [Pseudomonas borbori]
MAWNVLPLRASKHKAPINPSEESLTMIMHQQRPAEPTPDLEPEPDPINDPGNEDPGSEIEPDMFEPARKEPEKPAV